MRRILAALLIALAACSKTNPTRGSATQTGQTSVIESPQIGPVPSERKEIDSPPPVALETYRISGPTTHGNLSIFLFHSKNALQSDLGCLTLEDAFKTGAIKITEKSEGAEVNELEVENAGDRPVYLQAGDTVKGGKQDRTIAVDFILPPNSGKRAVDAFCVEPGRWSARDDSKNAATAVVFFEESKAPVATNAQKLAIRLEKSQDKVWAAGEKVNRDLVRNAGSGGPLAGATFALEEPKSSYVEAVENPEVQKKLAERRAALEKIPADQPDAVGAAFCVNGKIQGAEIYSTAGLFRKLWPKLLRSASVEAFAGQSDAVPPKAPLATEIRALLDEMAGRNGRAEIRPGGQVVRIFDRDRAVLLDTEMDGKLIHRQLITK
jgi:hypothetical protein